MARRTGAGHLGRAADPLVAHSGPGGLAARFAAQHGDLLRRLVLVDTAGLGRFRPSPGFLAARLRSNLRPTASNVERFLGRVMADIERTRAESGELTSSGRCVSSSRPEPSGQVLVRQDESAAAPGGS